VGAFEGKNKGLLPLWTCHLSHSKTIEKPKITHKTVRLISFIDQFISLIFLLGTRSIPPAQKGWQRQTRRKVK